MIDYSVKNDVAYLNLNNPPVNIMSAALMDEMSGLLETVAGDRSLKAVAITAEGKAFCAGADVGEHRPEQAAGMIASFGRLFRKLDALEIPLVMAAGGAAMGAGFELILMADVLLASENAKFGQPEVNLGVIPGFGGTQRLPRLIGKGLATELLYSGDIIDAQEALRIGLVNKVFAQEELLGKCLELAEKIASRGPLAVKLCKEAVNNGMEMDLSRACQYEVDLFSICFSSVEQKEGMSAFLEKRSPKFKG
jgi:enoyl-CoA hydratase